MTLIQTVMTLIQTIDNLKKKSPACADQAFFQSGPTLTTLFIVDEEREDSNTIKSVSSLARQRDAI